MTKLTQRQGVLFDDLPKDFKGGTVDVAATEDDVFCRRLKMLDNALIEHFSDIFVTDNALTRKLVSFQANKSRSYYRWYKYKEAFSTDLVEYLFRRYPVAGGKILDPFAGAGTALFTCASLGHDAEGIELSPIGQKIINANILARGAMKDNIISRIEHWRLKKPWNNESESKQVGVLRITDGAYPRQTDDKIGQYLYCLEHESAPAKEMLLFALLCVLESVSYTRKDGQYLRWDYRAKRLNGKNNFDKGKILPFDDAITQKLNEIKSDMVADDGISTLFPAVAENTRTGKAKLLKGSCLEILPELSDGAYAGIMTSPPYCNRYDYTRTYALELALLGINEHELVGLRQAMLSCTVENKAKALTDLNRDWRAAVGICDGIPLLQQILDYLDDKKEKGELNNSGIARMVRGYFYETACVIFECYRLLRKGGIMFMVNDNVRYAGVAISVDAILSKIAEDVGFRIENILVLPGGKGNSSQQMGRHGREVLRKCVYVWKKGE